jgi:hypothetical protein
MRGCVTIRVLIRIIIMAAGISVAFFMASCRGMPKEKSPIHLIRDMDDQPRYKPQSENFFFADGITMRTPLEGVVARGDLREDDRFYLGQGPDGSFIRMSPVSRTPESLARGEERYGIYCLPCHGTAGDGKGPITRYAYPIPPTSLHEQRITGMPDGEIFNIISNGIRNMPSYKEQIPALDRWHIVAYVRQLQQEGPRIAESETSQKKE